MLVSSNPIISRLMMTVNRVVLKALFSSSNRLPCSLPRARGEGGAKYFPRESKSFSSTSQTAAGSFCRSSEMQRMRKRKEERQKQLFYFLDLIGAGHVTRDLGDSATGTEDPMPFVP